jgi:hypothetical protein
LHLLHLVDLLLLVNGFPRGQLLVVGSRVGQLVFDAPASSLGRGLGLFFFFLAVMISWQRVFLAPATFFLGAFFVGAVFFLDVRGARPGVVL